MGSSYKECIMPKKMPSKGLSELIGKQVYVKQTYEDTREGPFVFLDIDQNFIKLKLEDEEFWWNLDAISGVRLYNEEPVSEI